MRSAHIAVCCARCAYDDAVSGKSSLHGVEASPPTAVTGGRGDEGSPSAQEVVRLRQAVQDFAGVKITDGQDLCAQMLHTSRRAWQQWERGERRMHAAFWALARLRLSLLRGELVPSGSVGAPGERP